MIRSANHSSFPKLGESPLDQQLRVVRRRHEAGRATDRELLDAADEVTTITVAQQSRAFIDIVTDGMIRWDGPISHLAGALEGLETRELQRWFHTNLYQRRVAVTGPIRRRAAFLEHDYRVAQGVSQTRPVKLVLPGPVTCARLVRDEHYGDRGALARDLAQALAEEVAHLAQAGASCFQLDEPLLCRHAEDLDLLAETAGHVFRAAGSAATTILSTYYGDLAGLADRLERLPGSHLGLDLTHSTANYDLLRRLPEGRGVYLGLFDASTTCQEDATDVAELLEPYREQLVGRDVIVGPNAGLELIPRDAAFDKLLHARYLTEKLSQEWTWRC